MKVIQVNPKYKLWYAFGLFAVFLLLLSVYYAVTRNITETLYNVPTWGIPCIFIYYIFIHRMKIMITDEKSWSTNFHIASFMKPFIFWK